MSAVDLAVARLKVNEGFRAQKYLDTVGKETIGYGFNISAGITENAAQALLAAQTEDICTVVSGYWWSRGLDDARFSVVIEVAFNVGIGGLLHFTDTLTCIGNKDWVNARLALLDSDAARMLPTRYAALAQILLTGGALA